MENDMPEVTMKDLKKGEAVMYRGVAFVGSDATEVTQEWLDNATSPRIKAKASKPRAKAKKAD